MHDYPLRGFVFCQTDRRRYTGVVRRTTNKSGIKEAYNYRCGRQFDSNPFNRCHNRIWNAKNFEAMVWEKVESVLSSPETVLLSIKVVEENAR